MRPFRGLYRDVGWAYVTNGTTSFQVPEADYRSFDYEPAYEKLPWKEDYVATKPDEAHVPSKRRDTTMLENLSREFRECLRLARSLASRGSARAQT